MSNIFKDTVYDKEKYLKEQEDFSVLTSTSDIFKNVKKTPIIIEEIKENIKEVIGYQVEYLEEKGEKEKAENLKTATLKYFIDLNCFFEYYSLFNKSELAKYIGINPSHLRRLSMENMELSDQKAQQIEQGLKRLSQELSQYCFS